MAIGTLGTSIVFEVTDEKVMTFTEMNRTVTGNWASHAVIGQKPKSEFLGAALQTITFNIVLNAALGVRPRAILDAIAKMVEAGAAEYFVVGSAPVGKNPWKITSVSETWNTILNKGELMKASLSLSLEEYI
jgi:phage protein U